MYCYDTVSATISQLYPFKPQMVMGYVTGPSWCVWTQAQFDSFGDITKLYVDQGHGTAWRRPTVIDVEAGDYTPGQIGVVSAGIAAKWGPGPLAVYAIQSSLGAVHQVWKGPIILACPSFPTDAEAIALRTQLQRTYPGINIVMMQNVWVNNKYDRSLVFDLSWLNPKVTPAKPPAVDAAHLLVDGWELPKAPGTGPVPAVIKWYGDDGLVTRQWNIPRAVWSAIKWSVKGK